MLPMNRFGKINCGFFLQLSHNDGLLTPPSFFTIFLSTTHTQTHTHSLSLSLSLKKEGYTVCVSERERDKQHEKQTEGGRSIMYR